MKKKVLLYLKCFIPAAKKWWKDKHADDAAALAFYSLISLVPLLLISVYIASIVVDEETAKRIIVAETDRVAGKSIGQYIAGMLHSEIKFAGSSYSPFIGVFLIIFSSTKMVSELRHSLAKVFGTREKKRKRLQSVYDRALAQFGHAQKHRYFFFSYLRCITYFLKKTSLM